jgi:hypothetical protein
VPICLDSKGARLRNQGMASGIVVLEEGSQVMIHFTPILGDAANISFTPAGMARQLVVGDENRHRFRPRAPQGDPAARRSLPRGRRFGRRGRQQQGGRHRARARL